MVKMMAWQHCDFITPSELLQADRTAVLIRYHLEFSLSSSLLAKESKTCCQLIGPDKPCHHEFLTTATQRREIESEMIVEDCPGVLCP